MVARVRESCGGVKSAGASRHGLVAHATGERPSAISDHRFTPGAEAVPFLCFFDPLILCELFLIGPNLPVTLWAFVAKDQRSKGPKEERRRSLHLALGSALGSIEDPFALAC